MARKTQQNNITNPELLAKVNPKNIRLLDDYLNYLKSVQRAELTIKSYKNDVEIFFCWVLLNADNKFFVEISKRDIIAYQNYLLNTNKNSPARVRRLKSTLSGLSSFIENILDDEFPNYRSIVKKIESPLTLPMTKVRGFLDDNR